MAQKIVIKTESKIFEAELNESMTGKAIYDALPIRAKAQRWGGEIYFNIPVSCELEENSREVLDEGELGYWPPGKAPSTHSATPSTTLRATANSGQAGLRASFCIFFGPTPASVGDEIRAASAVNIVGTMK